MDIQKFDELVSTMDIPQERLHDWNWLIRNLGIRNSNHPNFQEAKQMIKDEIKALRN